MEFGWPLSRVMDGRSDQLAADMAAERMAEEHVVETMDPDL
jgi:hypothetical protein